MMDNDTVKDIISIEQDIDKSDIVHDHNKSTNACPSHEANDGKNNEEFNEPNFHSQERETWIMAALHQKQTGNTEFVKKRYSTALAHYQKGLEYLKLSKRQGTDNDMTSDTKSIDEERHTLELTLESNASLAFFRLHQYYKSYVHIQRAIEISSTTNTHQTDQHQLTKLLFRRAMALEKLTLYEDAKSDLCRCLEIHNSNTEDAAANHPSHQQAKQTAITALSRINDKIANPANIGTTDKVRQYHHHHRKILPSTTQCQIIHQLFQQQLSKTTGEEETYYILDWNWWGHWCHHVKFLTYWLQLKGESERNSCLNNDYFYFLSLDTSKRQRQQQLHQRGLTKQKTDLNESSSEEEGEANEGTHHLHKKCTNANVVKYYHDYTPPGPIDNSAITLSTAASRSGQQQHRGTPLVFLRHNLVRGYHYEVIPREVYHALRCWYGEITVPILRVTTSTNVTIDKCSYQIQLPLYPEYYRNTQSLNKLKHHLQTNVDSTTVATSSANGMKGLCFTCRAPTSRRCTGCYVAYYCNRDCQASHWMYHKRYCNDNHQLTAPPSRWGLCGLGNLGNTCFMNSALQCLSHTNTLTNYWITNRYLYDLNLSNPLGSGGRLAHAIADLIKELWIAPVDHYSPSSSWSSHDNGNGINNNDINSPTRRTSSYTMPSQVKRAVATYAPRFAGCAQHDSQEFLAYLLDGLHEDLNRVRGRKPYVSTPDHVDDECIGDDGRQHSIDGAQSWDAYQKRNNSHIIDSFYGQFKSTCICPLCERVSVSFDVFNHISLEIPRYGELSRSITVLLQRQPCAKISKNLFVRYLIKTPQKGSIWDVKVALSKLSGIPVGNILLADVSDGRLYEIYRNNKSLLTLLEERDDEERDALLHGYEIAVLTDDSIRDTSVKILAFLSHTKTIVELPKQFRSKTIGFSFMLSFEAHSTCLEVLQQVWLSVYPCLGLTHATEHDAGKLRVKVVDRHGNELPVFKYYSPDSPSYLPYHSSLRLMDALCEDYKNQILFLTIEWGSQYTLSNGEIVTVDEGKFLAFEDDQSACEDANGFGGIHSRIGKGHATITLEDCLRAFSSPERLDEQNAWFCFRCKKHVLAMKSLEVWRLPNVLIIHLKRFDSKSLAFGLRRDKLDTFVDFPRQRLDMSCHCAAYRSSSTTSGREDDFVVVHDKIPAEYDLFGVINHHGRMGFGHYTSYVRKWNDTGIDDTWTLFDDSSATQVGNEAVVTAAAYVLFYRRRIFT